MLPCPLDALQDWRKGNPDFDLDELDDQFCWAHFRFLRADVRRLAEALGLPDRIPLIGCRTSCPKEEAVAILLIRLSFPNR